ncbi:MAG: alcohol dehydrogenase catalytic domain-containing protein [Pseudomonadota bacterium]|nr:alcohol dehydrogenase catalytic domain-containing protein [Pseudomonadota bacterium]
MPGVEKIIVAVVAHGNDGPFVTETLRLRSSADSELLIKIVATSVCRTDVMTKSKGLCEFPILLGHEDAGVVKALFRRDPGKPFS